MHLNHGIHLAYCTNIHRGETWEETLAALEQHTLEVRRRVAAPDQPYAIGLRLGVQAARSLTVAATRLEFRRWLERHNCYVFTINGFPYGQFHGTRVKEQVFQPDWATQERLDYTKALFDIIADLAPAEAGGSVSTLPGSHKELMRSEAQAAAIRQNLLACADYVARLSDRNGKDLHLGLEPEPLGWVENSAETVALFDSLGRGEPLRRVLGVNYDTCHLAVEYEEAAAALSALTDAGIRISKLHLSSALRVPFPADAAARSEILQRLTAFQEDVYFHQTIARHPDGTLQRHRDLPDALAHAAAHPDEPDQEWRIHFHIPLHASPDARIFRDTRDHLTGTLDVLAAKPDLCRHIEMETYTWAVLPQDLRSEDVVTQLEKEYAWTLGEMKARGLA